MISLRKCLCAGWGLGRGGRDAFSSPQRCNPALPWLPRGRPTPRSAGPRPPTEPQTPSSALRPFPPACFSRSSTARGRARRPGGRGPLVVAGSGGGGPAASWLPPATRGAEGKPEELGRKRRNDREAAAAAPVGLRRD